jgi:hypothetical protein
VFDLVEAFACRDHAGSRQAQACGWNMKPAEAG